MDDRVYARYLADIAYFSNKFDNAPASKYFIPIALAYNKLQKYEESIDLCKAGLLRFPANNPVKTLLAEALFFMGNLEEAKDLLFDVVTEDDGNFKAFKLLGLICKASAEEGDALRYFRAAYIRSPEDQDLKLLIEELGGSVDPSDILRERKYSAQAGSEEEDEESKTYKEIDLRIRNAEMVMADFASDKNILSTPAQAEATEAPPTNMLTDDELERLLAQSQGRVFEEKKSDVKETTTAEIQGGMNSLLVAIEKTPEPEVAPDTTNDLAAALFAEEPLAEAPAAALSEEISQDLMSALETPTQEEQMGGELEEGLDDLAAALSSAEISEEKEDNPIDDLAAMLSSEQGSQEQLAEDGGDYDLANALLSEEDAASEQDILAEPSDDIMSALSKEHDSAISGEQEDLFSALTSQDDVAIEALPSEEHQEVIQDELASLLGEPQDNVAEIFEKVEEPPIDIVQEPAEPINLAMASEETPENINPSALKDSEPEGELDFSGLSKIAIDEAEIYKNMSGFKPEILDELSDNPTIELSDDLNVSQDLGESAPFTQSDIFDEILSAADMTADDMVSDDEPIAPKADKIKEDGDEQAKKEKLLKMQSKLLKMKGK